MPHSSAGTASGKTSVCKKITEQLKLDVHSLWPAEAVVSITQDKFYKDLSEGQKENIGDYNFDHPDAFDFEETIDLVSKLKEGKAVEIPRYSFVTSSRLEETDTVVGAEVVIFEGILALYNPKLRDLFDMKIFVDTDSDTRLARRLRRDIKERGRDVVSVLAQYEKTVKPSFDEYILPTKRYADIIVPRGAENTVAIDLITQHLRVVLERIFADAT